MSFKKYVETQHPEYYEECGMVRRIFPQLIATQPKSSIKTELFPIEKVKARIMKKLLGNAMESTTHKKEHSPKIKKLAKQIKVNISKIDPDELKMGMKVEKEHMRDKDINVVHKDSDVLKIALAHLREMPDYYTKLKKMEEQ